MPDFKCMYRLMRKLLIMKIISYFVRFFPKGKCYTFAIQINICAA